MPTHTKILTLWDTLPLFPVTVTLHRQLGDWWQVVLNVRVEFALPPDGTETLLGFRFGVIPVVGLAVAVRRTVPEKPLMLATVMVAELHA